MPNIGSYFNPVSPEHHAAEDFKKLSAPKQALTIVLTVFATILTLPILGLGGVATFRALTEDFFIKKLDVANPSSPQELAAHKAHSTVRTSQFSNTSSEKIPLGTQKKYIDILSSYFKIEGKTLHNESSTLLNEKDTFFEVAAKSLNTSPDKIIQKMKEYMRTYPEEFDNLIKTHSKDTDRFKKCLLDENTISKTDSSESFSNFQSVLNRLRSDLLTKIYPVRVVVYEMYINHDENYDKSQNGLGRVFPETGPYIDIMPYRQRAYGDGIGNKTLEIATAAVKKENGEKEKPDIFFVQPRLLTKTQKSSD